MAQGLKAGEFVSLLKKLSVSKTDPAYEQGLKRLKAGQVGQVVGAAGTGRSMIVDFGGKHIALPSRQLERIPPEVAQPTVITQEPIKKSKNSLNAHQNTNYEPLGDQPAPIHLSALADGQDDLSQEFGAKSEEVQTSLTPSGYTGVNYNTPGFITAAANKLLISGNHPETLLIELRFGDLPLETRDQITALIQAKLELGASPKSTRLTVPKSGAKRRGRPPTKHKM